jgi:hypothetical protein
MARKKTIPLEKVAAHLAGGSPLDWHKRQNGTLVVITAIGQKKEFTRAEVRKATDQLRKEAAS